MRATLKRTFAWTLAIALLVTCTVSGLVLPALADLSPIFFEDGVVTVPAKYNATFDVLGQLKAKGDYTIDPDSLTWTLSDNETNLFRGATNVMDYVYTLTKVVTNDKSVIKTAKCDTDQSLTGAWSFGCVNPTVTVQDADGNTATATIRWQYETTPFYLHFEDGQAFQCRSEHAGVLNYIQEEDLGNHAIKMPTSARNPARLFTYIAWQPNSVYKISFDYKNEAGAGTRTIAFPASHYFDVKMEKTLSSDKTTTGWQHVETTITTGARPIITNRYAFFMDRGTAGTGDVWMDNIRIDLISSPATAITVKPEAPTMEQGTVKQFTVEAVPENASAGTITWSVDDPAKATITDDGKLTALADSGTVIVKAQSSYGLTDTTVVTLIPEKVADPAVVFESDFEKTLSSHFGNLTTDDKFAVVEEEGNISNHVLKISKTSSGRWFKDLNLIPGRTYKLSFKIKGAELKSYVTGGYANPAGYQTHTPTDADTWTTVERFMTIPYTLIHAKGNSYFALRNDEATPAYIDDIEFRLVDADPAPEAMEFDFTQLKMKPGRVRALTLLGTPEVFDMSGIVWTSSNEAVAYVIPGQVFAVGAGTATITATAPNGKAATAQVTVTEHAAFIKDATFESSTTEWQLADGAEKLAEAGYYYQTALKLPAGSSAKHTLVGLKANTAYTLDLMQASLNYTACVNVTITNGENKVASFNLGKGMAYAKEHHEFTTGDITGDCVLTITNTSARAIDMIHIDNVVLAEVVSDVDPDLVVGSDFEDTLSAEWSTVVKKNDSRVEVIKDPDNPLNHILKLEPFGDASGRYFAQLDNIIPGRSYKMSFKLKGAGAQFYVWPGIFAKPGSLASLGWEDYSCGEDPNEWITVETVWQVDPMLYHHDQNYTLAIKNPHVVPYYIDDFELRLIEPDAAVEELTFNLTDITLAPGRTQNIALKNTPDVADLSGLQWHSTNEQIAYVLPGQDGPMGAGKVAKVVAVGSGKATITATANNGKVATCEVTVNGTDAFLGNVTLNDIASTVWTLADGAVYEQDKGYAYTGNILLPNNASMSQPIKGLKSNAKYQLFLSTSWQNTGDINNLKVQIYAPDGETLLLDTLAAKVMKWTENKFEFSTGEITGDCKVVLTNTATNAKNTVRIDNVFLAEAVSDIDLIVSDFFWDNDDGTAQVKPGTPMKFTVVIANAGTEDMRAGQSFDVDILVDAKKVLTATYTGALAQTAITTIEIPSEWIATEGDHMLVAEVNTTMKVVENNTLNNDMIYNLRVADDVLIAPDAAMKHGFNKLTFADDFNSLNTFDVNASGKEGYHWYVTRLYGETNQILGKDYTVKDGVLTVHSVDSAWAYSIATVDTKNPSGFVYNKGYLECRVRLPYTSKDLNKLENGVRNPGIWAFGSDTMWQDVFGKDVFNGGKSSIETDWIEFKGTKYRNPKTMEKEASFHFTLHDRGYAEDGTQNYWAAHGEEFYYTDGYVISGKDANDMGDWHTLGWAWAHNVVEMYVDGKLIHVKQFSEDGFPNPKPSANKGYEIREGTFADLNEQYNTIILGAQDEFRMELDYVRVWQSDGSIEVDEYEDPVVTDFFAKYQPTTKVTVNNYERLLEGASVYVTLDPEQQAAIDKKLGKSYLEITTAIQNDLLVVDNFIPFYACAEDGTPYTVVDATNYEWIAGAQTEWESLSDFARALINARVQKANGMTFDELLQQALAFVPETVVEPEPLPDTQLQVQQKANLTWLWISLAAVAIILVAGGATVAIIMFSKKRKKQ